MMSIRAKYLLNEYSYMTFVQKKYKFLTGNPKLMRCKNDSECKKSKGKLICHTGQGELTFFC